MPRTIFSDYIFGGAEGNRGGIDNPDEVIALANGPTVIGGYRDGLTVQELDDPKKTTWSTDAVRDAVARDPNDGDTGGDGGKQKKWPFILFSHGAGAYRPSYSYWTEFLASHGFVVAAPDHPGSSRFTM